MTSGAVPTSAASESSITDRMLAELTHLERADLLQRVQSLTASEFNPSQRVRTAGRWFVRFLAVCCLGLIPWTIGLAMTLPRHYVVGNWRLAWTGFDVALLGCLSLTAWALWKQRQIVVPASMITGVLLSCDAWFDILTANGHRQLFVSIASALFGELPLALMLFLLSVRALRVGARVTRGLEPNARISPLWCTPLVAFPELSKQALFQRGRSQ
jgi:hypothetical protein